MRTALSWFVLCLLLPACGGAAGPAHLLDSTAPAEVQPSPVPDATPTADFGSHWPGVTVTVESTGESHEQADGMARAVFQVVWTAGEQAGVLYPKKFVVAGTDDEVAMKFQTDASGDIAAVSNSLT
jgi:hypothetical protein